jgi:hypothetical protein
LHAHGYIHDRDRITYRRITYSQWSMSRSMTHAEGIDDSRQPKVTNLDGNE